MNHLLEQLKLKPKIETFQKVQVMIPGKINNESRTIIVDERDKGYDREALMKRMMERKLTKVSVQKNIVPQEITEEPREEIQEKEDQQVEQRQPIQRKKRLVLMGEEERKPEEQITKREEEEPIQIIAETSKRKTERVEKGTVILGPEILVEIGDTKIEDRLAKKLPPVIIKVSSYYMNNREFFINFINSLFEPYRREVLDTSKNISCDNIGQDAEDTMNQLLIHQKVVRDYINLYTPYRGLLLYHGLGSGKTASSIAIAEGMKERKRVIVMTPASLRRNYMEEIKKFGDQIYKKNQFWEWVSLDTYPEALKTLTTILNLSADYIRRQKGAWFVNVKKSANYNDLTSEQKKSLEDQLDEMIRAKYTFINYNGLRLKRLEELTQGFTHNLFDNCVVIIDEAHNLISRIVNKIKKEKPIPEDNRGEKERAPKNLAVKLYEYLMSAKDARIILLSGTPIINYPNEFGILFNILRGYIKTWEIPLQIKTTRKIDRDALRDMLVAEKSMDYIDYSPSSKILTITRNPFGFKDKYSKDGNDYQGVYNNVKDENGLVRFHMETDFLNEDEFERRISGILKRNEIEVLKTGIKIRNRKALPDDFDEFKARYINSQTNELINSDALKRRILGLSSYFKSAQEGLLPRFDKVLGKDYHVVKIPMSDFQFKIYEDARREERKMEKPGKTSKKDDLYEDKASTYRIFSRLFCNFVIKNRPLPNDENIAEVEAEGEKQPMEKSLEEIQELKQQEKELKRDEKEEKVAEKQRKQEEKEKKEREKQLEKERKQREKEEKQQEKERKQREKEEKQKEKERKQKEKEEKKAEKERKQKEKSEKKVGGALQDEVEEEEEQQDEDEEDNDDKEEEEEEEEQANPEKKKSVFFNLDKILKTATKIQSQEDDLDNENEGEIEGDAVLNELGGKDYEERQRSFLKYIKEHANEYLTPEALQRHSPKYLTILENLLDPEYEGLHLVYSQFRTLEGLGIFSLVLEQNGFAEFKLKKNTAGIWDIDIKFEDLGKPTFALYTGTETAEEKEIIRNIYNGDWDYVPTNITKKLRNIANNNNVGEIIKVLMITSSGSEGINLKNTRYVHIMEPYWHPVRSEQVIGRARRICSHKNLPDKLQTVEVFVYLMTFTATQLKSDEAIELKRKDTSKISNVPLTSDEYLYEISEIKAKLNAQLINSIKESAFDCYLYSNIPGSKGTGVQCVNFGDPSKEKFSYVPNFAEQQNDITLRTNKRRIEWEGFPIRIGDKDYVYRRMNKNLMNIYDLASYEEALRVEGVQPVQVGTLETNEKGQKVFKSLVL